ncbi:hypothetical protein D3C72_2502710 [compost metagenome]
MAAATFTGSVDLALAMAALSTLNAVGMAPVYMSSFTLALNSSAHLPIWPPML